MGYRPTLESIRSHPVPEWYDDAKLGIFVHWTLASVPGFAPREHDITQLLRTRYRDMQTVVPYTEWYENSLRFPDSPVARFHREHYGDRPYAAFREPFLEAIARWDPDDFAARFAATGARYVVLVTKHHDGFCLWPSEVRNPNREAWSSERDCVGELAEAVRARGMRFGVYYSGGLDWTFEPRPIANIGDLVAAVPGGRYPAYAEAQVRELIARYRPDVLWNDIAWPTGRDGFVRLIADYYDAVPEGVINDRWQVASPAMRAMRSRPVRAVVNRAIERRATRPGANITPPPSLHFDARTPEYAVFPEIRAEKWECVRGMDKSFGYNRCSLPEDFLGREELIRSLADIASKNGNLLLNVGPRGEEPDIPEPQRERLDWLGEWLGQCSEAIHGTRPWHRAEGESLEGIPLRFTAREGALYAIALGTPPATQLTLRGPGFPEAVRVERLGGGAVRSRLRGADLHLEWDAPLAPSAAHAFAIRPA